MKEFIVIHDYLVSEAVVGDWDGEEELVAERINEIYHTLYDMAEEDIAPEELIAILELVWETWIPQEALPELDMEDIYDWCRHVLANRDQYIQQ
ncbi:hypothetical protein DXX93_11740 [Thalassotalea euphylliae]|uniref:Uncharacterized protein n=1 Tax=Thalassotalea euphylliae TaxID=1655234 RepID=A0A3E0TS28_9GAMM|nr:hypothetical protein [Thalassotalea euphylliae]REL27170.1 hypothetical protein DXX93_11740 [Thalassotalea euphylliae]